MSKEFNQSPWDQSLEWDLRRLLEIAVSEDTENIGDLTSLALIPAELQGSAGIHARERGVLAGGEAVPFVLNAVDRELSWMPDLEDGAPLAPDTMVGRLRGPVRTLLTAERLVLNLLGKLSGIATLTRRYVDAVQGTDARIYDTRKTTLGWRKLEKYAVLCGGGHNHRTGLYDAILIKDNHLAFGSVGGGHFTPAEAVARARQFASGYVITQKGIICRGAGNWENPDGQGRIDPIVEIEVDTLRQLEEVLPAGPDIVLLDNMVPDMLRQAVEIRNRLNPTVELEASGGINLNTVRAVAETGVDRISVGALTHSAVALDLGLDWNE